MSLEQDALDFVHNLQQAYFGQGDASSLLAFAETDITMIGSGGHEVCHDYGDLQRAAQRGQTEYSGGFTIGRDQYRAMALSDSLCLVYGELTALSKDPEMADISARGSLICRRTPDGMRLVHLHYSHPDTSQEDGSYYVRRLEAMTREALQIQVTDAKQGLTALSENIPGGAQCCLNDDAFTILDVSDSFLTLFGYTRDEIRTQFHDSQTELIYPEDRQAVLAAVHEQLQHGDTIALEYRMARKDGALLWVMDKGKLVQHPDGSERFYCVLLDITEQKQKQEELRLSLERHQAIMDQATDIIFEWDMRTDTLVYSTNWQKRFGYPPITEQASVAIPKSRDVHPDDIPTFMRLVQDTAAGTPCCEVELRLRDAMDSYIWCRVRATTQFSDSGIPVRAVGVIVDIDEDKKQRQKLIERAQRDSLTWLLNKAATKNQIAALLAAPNPVSGVLFIVDLDDFKAVNDTYGHLCGDTLLTDVAGALKKLFRADDVVGRVGGDEFLIFLPEYPVARAAEKAAQIRAAFQEVRIAGTNTAISACIGIACAPGDAQDFYQLYHCADCALYQAKRTEKGSYAVYDTQLCLSDCPPTKETSYAGSAIDSDFGVVKERVAQYAFRMLYDAKDIPHAIGQILEIVGRSYDVARIYIAEDAPDGGHTTVTYSWCDEGSAMSEDNVCQSYSGSLLGLRECFDPTGVLFCPDIHTLPPNPAAFFERFGARSLLMSAIMEEGRFFGVVGIEDCHTNRVWTQDQIDSLGLVAKVVSTFLLKLRYKERIQGI